MRTWMYAVLMYVLLEQMTFPMASWEMLALALGVGAVFLELHGPGDCLGAGSRWPNGRWLPLGLFMIGIGSLHWALMVVVAGFFTYTWRSHVEKRKNGEEKNENSAGCRPASGQKPPKRVAEDGDGLVYGPYGPRLRRNHLRRELPAPRR